MLNRFDEGHWLRHFSIIKTIVEMVCDEIGVMVRSVVQSHDLLRQSHMTFLMFPLYSLCMFLSDTNLTEHVSF